VDVAHSGEVADELAGSNRYDAIVFDWLLPRKDGLALCRGLRGRGIIHTVRSRGFRLGGTEE
jgi:DNA-binding response OmpR family regulator